MSDALTDDPLAAELAAADEGSRLKAIARIMELPAAPLSQAALEALLRCAGAESKAEQRRAAEALAATARHDPRITERLRGSLRAGSARARWGAAYALGLLCDALDPAALPSLAEALSNRDGDVRWAAAELIVRLGRAAPDPVLAEMKRLGREGEARARRMALYCLRDLGARGEDLLALAGDCCEESDALLRLAALSMVSRLDGGDPRGAELAMRLLSSDPHAGVRRSAAAALGSIGNRSDAVVRALRRAAEDGSDRSLKRSAEAALRRLGL